MIKLNYGLKDLAPEEAIKAIVAHELAHFALGHHPGRGEPAAVEKAANRLIRDWGFQKEFLIAGDKLHSSAG